MRIYAYYGSKLEERTRVVIVAESWRDFPVPLVEWDESMGFDYPLGTPPYCDLE